MKPIFKFSFIASFVLLTIVSCKKDNDDPGKLTLNITGLEDLGSNARYEGWIISGGVPVSTGIFSVNASGQLSQTSFDVDKQKLESASAFVLTIEPFPDTDAAPSEQHLLAGDFNSGSAGLSIGHPAALNTNFSTATGKYVLATPTTAATADELSGLWFLSLMTGSPTAGLSLPSLPAFKRFR